MKRYLLIALVGLLIILALVVGIVIGDKRDFGQMVSDLFHWRSGSGESDLAPPDPVLQAALPTADPESIYPGCPLNALLKPDLTPQEQTGIVGQMLIDFWTSTRSLPNGTWEEICSQLAGNNRQKLAFVPPGHPALGEDCFMAGQGQPGIRLHVIGSSSCSFQLIYNGPDGLPYTQDDQIRNFPQDLEIR